MADTKLKEQVSYESWEEKKLACAIFGKIWYAACAINFVGKLICLRACLHAGLIDEPALIGMFLTSVIQNERNFFFKKDTFNEASNPRTLYLSKTGPDFIV